MPNIKLTPKQIKEVKRYKRANWSYAKIAKEFNVCERTIRRIAGISHIYTRSDSSMFDGKEVPLWIKENIKKGELEEPENRIRRGVCKICGKAKEEKFRLTHFCGLKCFKVLTKPF